jgi:hypothetical protein
MCKICCQFLEDITERGNGVAIGDIKRSASIAKLGSFLPVKGHVVDIYHKQ